MRSVNDASKSKLLVQLPAVRGSYRSGVELSKLTWFRVGGACDVLYKPADIEDLCHFLKHCPQDVPIFPMGVGSNLIVRDGGIPGVVIRLGAGFQNVFAGDACVDIGAGVLDKNLSVMAGNEGWGGLEFFCGIPGTIGGALRMNAGCYGSEVKDVLEYAYVVTRDGDYKKMSVDELGYSYRHCSAPSDVIFVGARFKFKKETPALVQERIEHMLAQREATQPIKERTGGSTFANPEGASAWELIDQAGFRGKTMGGAKVSEKHCNFLLNDGNASAYDLESLGETIRDAVKVTANVELRWEIQRVGVALANGMKKAA